MGADAPARAGLPAAAHVFCLPTTPPLYLDILRRLAQWIDLRLYVLNPCREYWFEAVDARRLSYLAAKCRADHHEVGNRLLAAWGQQTQAHIDLLLQDDSAAVVDDADFAPSEGDTLLAQLQNAILDMTDLARGSVALADGDRSVEVHVCHSLTRELEVLQDQLLALFAGPDPPRPSDILVVMPDLEAAAPLIDAVFGNAPKRAPDSVHDHRPAGERAQSVRAGAPGGARRRHLALPGKRRVRAAAAADHRAPVRHRRARSSRRSTRGYAIPASAGASTAAHRAELRPAGGRPPQLQRRPRPPVPRLRAARVRARCR